MGFEPVFQLAMPGENQCPVKEQPVSGCAKSSGGGGRGGGVQGRADSGAPGGSGQREVRTRMLGDACRKSVSLAGWGGGGGQRSLTSGIKTFPHPPRLMFSTGGRGKAHAQRLVSTGEAGSQALCPGPTMHRPFAANRQHGATAASENQRRTWSACHEIPAERR